VGQAHRSKFTDTVTRRKVTVRLTTVGGKADLNLKQQISNSGRHLSVLRAKVAVCVTSTDGFLANQQTITFSCARRRCLEVSFKFTIYGRPAQQMRTLYIHPVVSSFYLLLSVFFPRLFSAVADWMSTILPHMVWP